MPIKCKSAQIRTECYNYTMAAGENIFLPIKATRNEVIIVHSISVYNPTQANFTHVYKVIRTKGHLCRLNYIAAIATLAVQRWATEVYLIDGEECGIALTPNAAGDMVEVTFQIIRMRDDEYLIAT